MIWNTPPIRSLIDASFQEDSAQSDLTTRLLIDPSWRIETQIVSKASGVVAGLPLAGLLFKRFDRTLLYKALVTDGTRVRPHTRLALIKGSARSILSAERPALNALQHLSGIATFTHAQVQKLKGTRVRLYDTRKTLPGWRALQKYAVRCGGGQNHRMSLGDAILIKENHLFVARRAGADWAARLQKARRVPIQMEIQTQRDLRDALRLRPERVLLDNLPPRVMRRMIRVLRRAIRGIEIEITGGVRSENIRTLAKVGADRISMGQLTHSVSAFDCSLEITHVYPN